MRDYFRNGMNWVASGLVAAILMPLLVFGLRLPFVVALGISAVALFGVAFLLSPRALFEGLDVARIGKGKVEFARALLTGAAPHAQRLSETAERILDAGTALKVRHLADITRQVFRGLEEKPERAPAVQRFLSYYLPSAAEVANGFAVLEQRRTPAPDRLRAARGMIEKLEKAFEQYADSLHDEELGALDVDLRLLEASLKEDVKQS